MNVSQEDGSDGGQQEQRKRSVVLDSLKLDHGLDLQNYVVIHWLLYILELQTNLREDYVKFYNYREGPLLVESPY